jgi:hypothetical protein
MTFLNALHHNQHFMNSRTLILQRIQGNSSMGLYLEYFSVSIYAYIKTAGFFFNLKYVQPLQQDCGIPFKQDSS